VSLILEALRKLEREKGAPERGFTVLAAAPWPTRHRARLTGILAGGLLVAIGVAVGLVLRPGPPAPSSTAPAAAPPDSVADAPPPRTPLVVPTAFPLPPRPAPVARPAGVPSAAPPTTQVAAPEPREAPSPAPTPEALRLQAITEQDGRPVAVLNERIVHEGDEFDGIRVIRIGAGEVEVDVRGRRHILKF
jgi:hypothetical protein